MLGSVTIDSSPNFCCFNADSAACRAAPTENVVTISILPLDDAGRRSSVATSISIANGACNYVHRTGPKTRASTGMNS